MRTLNEIRAFFADDRFAMAQGIVIEEARDGHAVCGVTLDGRHQNAMGFAQGGFVFTLADFAFAVASNCETPGTVTLAATINYLRVPAGGRLTATAIRESAGRQVSVYRVEIKDDAGTPVALVSMTGFRKER